MTDSPFDTWPTAQDLLGPDLAAHESTTDTPWVRMIAAMTATGSATVDGTSGSLGNDVDSELLLAVRAWSDAVVVTAATVTQEGYGPVEPTGTRPNPPALAIVTRSLDISPDCPAISDATTPTLVVCPGADVSEPKLRDKAQALGDAGAVVLTAEPGPAGIVNALQSRGMRKLSLEGGPSLYSQFVAAGLVDEFYLTMDPTVTAAVPTPLVKDPDANSDARSGGASASAVPNEAFDLTGVHPCPDSVVFLHYVRRR